MAEGTVQKSLVEQILDDMFAYIEDLEEFDVHTIQTLKQSAASGNLEKARQVIRAIKSVPGGTR